MAMTLDEIKRLQTGQRVRVTWSGGNGPCDYTINRTPVGAIECCVEGLPSGYPGTLFDPIIDRSGVVAIHKVDLAE